MIGQTRVTVVMPAYHAARTLKSTVEALDRQVVDDVILVDDSSSDDTVAQARLLGIFVHTHERNLGYGGNQKTCYRLALERGADVVVMVHPDYQYEPRLVPALAGMIHSDVYDLVLASRILGGGALKGGMPLIKYIANRLLTAFQNLATGAKLSEYHSGYRAFSRRVLESLPLEENSDDFLFDNQMLCQAIAGGFRLGEISCPTRYFPGASSIGFPRAAVYGLGVIGVSLQLAAHRLGWKNHRLFGATGRKLAFRPRDS